VLRDGGNEAEEKRFRAFILTEQVILAMLNSKRPGINCWNELTIFKTNGEKQLETSGLG